MTKPALSKFLTLSIIALSIFSFFSLDSQNTISPVYASGVVPTGSLGNAYNWSLIFEDNFSGSSVNTSKWSPCIAWGITNYGCYENLDNYEWYLPANSTVSNGILRIQAKKQTVSTSKGTFHYTSGLINSDRDTDTTAIPAKFSFQYGYAEIRAKVPAGKGLWPAFWMLPSDHSTSNEIDVMEILGDNTAKTYMTYHYGSGKTEDSSYTTSGKDFSKDYHTFAVDWDPNYINWYVDGIKRYSVTNKSILPNKPFYLIANLQVGGPNTWPGAPDSSTTFPANYDIDYIRVWKKGSAATTNTGSTGGKTSTTNTTNTSSNTTTDNTALISKSTLPSIFTQKGSTTSSFKNLKTSKAKSFKNLTIEVKGIGKINWIENVDISSKDLKNIFNNLDKYIKFNKGQLWIDFNALPQLKKRATITLYATAKYKPLVKQKAIPTAQTPNPDWSDVPSDTVTYALGSNAVVISVTNWAQEYQIDPGLNVITPTSPTTNKSITFSGSVNNTDVKVYYSVNDPNNKNKLELAVTNGTFSKTFDASTGETTVNVIVISNDDKATVLTTQTFKITINDVVKLTWWQRFVNWLKWLGSEVKHQIDLFFA